MTSAISLIAGFVVKSRLSASCCWGRADSQNKSSCWCRSLLAFGGIVLVLRLREKERERRDFAK